MTAQRISVINGITGTIRDSIIAGASSGDDGRSADWAGLYLSDAAVIVENTTIRDNDVEIWTDEIPYSLTVRDSEICDNGVGIHARWELTETAIENTIVADNDVGADVYVVDFLLMCMSCDPTSVRGRLVNNSPEDYASPP